MKFCRSLPILIAALAVLLPPSSASAQSTLLQAGANTSGHAPMYVNQGNPGLQVIVQDAGSAAGGGPGVGLSELNITARGTGTAPYAGQGTGPNGEVFTVLDAPTNNAGGYHYLGFSANDLGGGLISYGAAGAASVLPLQFRVNGVTYQFPFSIGGVVGPSVSVVNDAACWNNTVGTLLKDCGAFVTVGGNNTWTGTNNFTGTFEISGTTQNFPASGNIVGTSDTQNLTNKSIVASEVNSGTLPTTVMPGLTGNVTSSNGSVVTTIAAGVVTNAMQAAMTQNAVKGAATSTAVADLAVPSCSAAGSALQWTTSTGFGCASLTNQSAGWGLTGSSTFSVSTSAPPFDNGYPINMGLSASVNASALTINLTSQDGSTPSSVKPVLIPFRSTTLTTGTTVWASVTGALSIIVPSAATLGTSNSVPFRIWIFAIYNSGTPELGVAVCSGATAIYPCTSWEVTRKTSTTIDGFATSSGTLYATGGTSSDAVRIIGYAEYSSGLATAGAYVSAPTTLQVMSSGIKKPGDDVQQVVTQVGTSTTGTTAFAIAGNGIPQNTAGDQYMSLAITPSSQVNLLKITAQLNVSNNSTYTSAALFQDSTANALAAVTFTPASAAAVGALDLAWLMVANTASSTTFKVRGGGVTGATTTFNGFSGGQEFGGAFNSFISIKEIMGALPIPSNDNINPGVYSQTG